MDSETKPRPSAVARFLGPTGQDSDNASGAGRDTRPAVPTPMIDVVRADGSIVSFSYAYLTKVAYFPGDTLTLYFGEEKVIAEGRNLRDLRQKVRLHKRDEIREGTDTEDALLPESAPHIDRITLDPEPQKETEQNYGTGRRKGITR